MDPVSIAHIASNAAGVAQTAWKIYEFIKSARNIDSTIRALQDEMKQVGEVFGLVKEQIKLLPEGSDLLKAIWGQIDACAAPVAAIDSKLKSGKQSNIFRQAFRQIKLSLSEEEIKTCQKQIQTSITNLQLSLQLVNLQATYIATQRADDILLSSLEIIQRTLDSQGQKIAEPVRRCATVYLSTGSTLYARSVLGGSVIGSESTPQSNTVSDWLNQMNNLKVSEQVIDSASDDTNLFLPDSPAPYPFEHAKGHGSDDSLNTQVIKASFELGKEAFRAKDFIKAEGLFNESFGLIRALPKQEQSQYDLEDLKLSHAVCAFYTQDSASAEAALAPLMQIKLEAPKNAEVRCEASSCLAMTYTRMERFDLAISICETLYQNQITLFGKDERCFKTIALLACIYNVQGRWSRAVTYRSLIPADVRDQYCKDLEDFLFTKIDGRSNLTVETLKLPPFQANFPDGLHLDAESIAWSPDNRYIAINRLRDPRIISLRCAMTGASLHQWKVLGYGGDSYDGEFFCFAFDTMTRKLAAAYSREEPAPGPKTCFIEAYGIQTREKIFAIPLMHKDVGRVLTLTFNAAATKILATFDNHRRAEGFYYAVIDVTTGMQLHSGRTKVKGKHVIWTTSYIALIGEDRLGFLNATTFEPLLWMPNMDSMKPIVTAGISSSEELMIICSDANLYTFKHRNLEISPGSSWLTRMSAFQSATMRFNSDSVMIVIAFTRSSCLYLAAPVLNKWICLRDTVRDTSQWRIGLSSDAKYAFWVERGENSHDIIHKWQVEKELDLSNLIEEETIQNSSHD